MPRHEGRTATTTTGVHSDNTDDNNNDTAYDTPLPHHPCRRPPPPTTATMTVSAARWKWSKEVTTRPGRNRPTRDGGRFPPAISAPSAYPLPVTHLLTTCKTQPPCHPMPPPTNTNPTATAATTPFKRKCTVQPLPHQRMWAPATSPAVTSAHTFNPPPPPCHQHPRAIPAPRVPSKWHTQD